MLRVHFLTWLICLQSITWHLDVQWGRFELRLCPLSADSDEAEKAELSDECLSKHPLTLADGSGPYFYPKVGRRIDSATEQ